MMKMRWFIIMMTVAALVLSSSCTDHDDETAADGRIPLVLTATAVDVSEDGVATRSTSANNTWSAGDRVAVKVNGTVKLYLANAASQTTGITGDGVANTHFWSGNGSTSMDVRAWFYGDNRMRSSCASWSVDQYQSSGSLQNNDFLYASRNIKYTDGPKSMNFYHQLCRVTVNVASRENTSANISKVELGSSNVALSGTFAEPSIGTQQGTWTAGTKNSTIVMAPITQNTKYEALVIPQTIGNSSTALLTFTMSDGSVLTYKAQLVCTGGKNVTYNVTIKNNNSLVVSQVSAAQWLGFNSVTAAPNGAKVGDIYYSDGTFSTSYNSSKTPIGIVCSINDGTHDGSLRCEGRNALVIALRNASSYHRWGPSGVDLPASLFPNVTSSTAQNDYLGHAKTDYLLTNYGSDYTAAYYAKNYGYSVCTPPSSTGWFLPSVGQWLACFRDLGGVSGTYGYSVSSEAAFTTIHAAMAKCGGYDGLTNAFWYTSSEASSTTGTGLWLNWSNSPGGVYPCATTKTDSYSNFYVRSFLAF